MCKDDQQTLTGSRGILILTIDCGRFHLLPAHLFTYSLKVSRRMGCQALLAVPGLPLFRLTKHQITQIAKRERVPECLRSCPVGHMRHIQATATHFGRHIQSAEYQGIVNIGAGRRCLFQFSIFIKRNFESSLPPTVRHFVKIGPTGLIVFCERSLVNFFNQTTSCIPVD